jgi:DNA-binding NtrC family response regulator
VVPSQARRFGELVGASLAMREVFAVLERVSASDVTVLVEGETGTGKELVARALHAASDRRAGPFVAVDCGALPEGLLDSELFGHVKGAFTGAAAPRAGCSRAPSAARSSSTSSAGSRPACRPACCACSRSASCGRWAAIASARSTCG